MTTPRVAILDYGCGNLASVVNAVRKIGGTPLIASNLLAPHTHIILPGQGAFQTLSQGWHTMLNQARERGTPILGICLGMQLMCESSEEAPSVKGLGWFPYRVERLKAKRLPHVGWNTVLRTMKGATTDYYFCHSYGVPAMAAATREGSPTQGQWIMRVDGTPYAAALLADNLMAVQFHPEKSGKAGLDFLLEFLAL